MPPYPLPTDVDRSVRAAARPVRVVQVIPIDGIGGVEVAARSALGPHPCMTFALAPIGGLCRADLPGEVLAPRRRSPDDPRAIIGAVCRVLRFRPDVVVGSLWRSVPVLLALRILRPRLRLVYFLHLDRPVHLADRLLSALGIAIADAIWCDSAVTRDRRLTGSQQRRSCVISFVTERLDPPPIHPVAPDFVVWSRLHHQKGTDRAIALIDRIVASNVEARFRIYGPDGGERSALEEQVRGSGLSERVSFGGALDPAGRRRAASEASFFLQLSRAEGMAMSVVEAMQLGLVPVVTAVGEICRYVQDGVNGVIVDPDDLGATVERIAELLASPERLRAMRDAAIASWTDAGLYRDEVAQAATRLLGTR